MAHVRTIERSCSRARSTSSGLIPSLRALRVRPAAGSNLLGARHRGVHLSASFRCPRLTTAISRVAHLTTWFAPVPRCLAISQIGTGAGVVANPPRKDAVYRSAGSRFERLRPSSVRRGAVGATCHGRGRRRVARGPAAARNGCATSTWACPSRPSWIDRQRMLLQEIRPHGSSLRSAIVREIGPDRTKH